MTEKEAAERMELFIKMLRNGNLSIHECESALSNVVSDVVRRMPAETPEQLDARIALVRKLKRRTWRMLLEATK